MSISPFKGEVHMVDTPLLFKLSGALYFEASSVNLMENAFY